MNILCNSHNPVVQIENNPRKGFTLVEVIVVLAVVAVLVSLRLPGLARAQGQSLQAQCTANLKQLTLAHLIYGNEFNDRLPSGIGGGWAWDVPPTFTDQLSKYGALRPQFYCPANPDQNQDGLWNYAPPQYRVTGYAETFPGSASVVPADQNPRLTPQQSVIGSVFLPAPAAAKRVLVADVIISLAGQVTTANKLSYQYKGIQGGFSLPHHTSHMDSNGRYPIGGNTGMLDGHVEWHSFSNVTCHTSGGVPGFWW